MANGFGFEGWLSGNVFGIISVPPIPYLGAGIGFDAFTVDGGVVFHAAAQASGLSERQYVLADFLTAEVAALVGDVFPHFFPESRISRIGWRWRVVLASRVMQAHRVAAIAAPVAALARGNKARQINRRDVCSLDGFRRLGVL